MRSIPTASRFAMPGMAILIVAVSAMGTAARAEENVLGVWDVKYSAGNRQVAVKLTIAKAEDGSLTGKWAKDVSLFMARFNEQAQVLLGTVGAIGSALASQQTTVGAGRR